jgi:hypothetical protein
VDQRGRHHPEPGPGGRGRPAAAGALRAARERPERWLAGYFLCGALLGSGINIAVYSSLGEGGLTLDPTLTGQLLMLSTAATGFAGTCIYLFTWRTFRADEAWAASLV